MDGDRFDRWTKRVAAGQVSRRTILRGVVGGTLGAAAALRGRRQSAAFICRQPGVLCAKDAHCCSERCGEDHRCACLADQTLCGRACADLAADVTHCGACGIACDAGQGCCAGSCTDLTTNDNCGSCGNQCTGATSCISGSCQSTCLALHDTSCTASDQCCGNAAGVICANSSGCSSGGETTPPGIQCCLALGTACTNACDCCGVAFCPEGFCQDLT